MKLLLIFEVKPAIGPHPDRWSNRETCEHQLSKGRGTVALSSFIRNSGKKTSICISDADQFQHIITIKSTFPQLTH